MAKSNVVPIGGVTKLDLPVETILEGAKDVLKSAILIGYDEGGEEYFASTFADGGDVLWLLERCKQRLLRVPENLG